MTVNGGNMKVRYVNLKEIVPDMERRCKKLHTLSIVFRILTLLIVPAIPAMIVLAKYASCLQLCRAINAVRMQDSTPLLLVFGYAPNAADAARKLIETGNLPGYKLVADAVLVREDIDMSEEQAIEVYAQYYIPYAAVSYGLTPETMPEPMKKAAGMQSSAAASEEGKAISEPEQT